jgi:hypothetical protein
MARRGAISPEKLLDLESSTRFSELIQPVIGSAKTGLNFAQVFARTHRHASSVKGKTGSRRKRILLIGEKPDLQLCATLGKRATQCRSSLLFPVWRADVREAVKEKTRFSSFYKALENLAELGAVWE